MELDNLLTVKNRDELRAWRLNNHKKRMLGSS